LAREQKSKENNAADRAREHKAFEIELNARDEALGILLETLLATEYPPIELPLTPTTNICIEDSLAPTIICTDTPNNIIKEESTADL